jgi:tetratricopeptide (TPR) repeat protein
LKSSILGGRVFRARTIGAGTFWCCRQSASNDELCWMAREGLVSGIFINYRGADSDTAAALIDRELTARFGRSSVFLDSLSIPAGADFVDELLGRLRTCSVLLVVIGSRWLTLTDAAGHRRIDDPSDWIRREIVEAFAHGLRVIPVLTDDAKLPAETELPADIAGLCRRQYVPLRRRYPTVDLDHLVARIIEAEPNLGGRDDRYHITGGDVHVHPLPQPGVVPRQLPPAPRWFTDRVDKVAALTAALDDAAEQARLVVISAIGGAGGIGKTWLALHWAHQHVDRFPDGQLFVDLRGFAPTGVPMAQGEAVRGFLDALGVDPQSIPVSLDAQVGRYRSLVAGKRMLIVLDNARDAAQVVPLLPGSPACTVLITSRDRMDGLAVTHGLRPLAVDVLDEPDARALLADRLGQSRVDAEPEATAELVACCAGLPLALSIVAGRAATQPDLPLAVLAAELRDVATRLGVLDDGDPRAAVDAVLSWSYAALTDQQARVFGLLGIAPGPDISLLAAASLTNLPTQQAKAILRALARVSLVVEHTPGRYRMHDLIRLSATQQAQRNQPPRQRDAALQRLVDFYLHTAYNAEPLLDPYRLQIEIGSPVPGCQPHLVPDQAAAWAWFDTEHPCLLACQRQSADQEWHTKVWQLAWALNTFHYRRGHPHEQLAAWEVGLVAAQHEGDPAALLRAHRLLGRAYARMERHAEALAHLGQSLVLSYKTGGLSDQADAHRALAVAWELQGDDQRALEHATSALRLFETLDQPAWEAVMLSVVGWYSARLSYYQQARTHCETALALCRRHHSSWGEAKALDGLGYVAHHTGRHDQALDYYQQARALYRDLGDTFDEADAADRLGLTQAALGHHDQARHIWHQALKLYQAQDRTTDADRVQQQLAALDEHL